VDLAPSPSESGAEMRSSLSARLKACRATDAQLGSPCCCGWPPGSCPGGLVLRPTGFYSFFLGAASRWSPNRFPTQREGFLHNQDLLRLHCLHSSGTCTPAGTATEVRPLISSPSSWGRSSGEPPGDLATPLVDCQTSWVYSGNLVQSFFISCYVVSNKLVLS
jgi:hypothetical protein